MNRSRPKLRHDTLPMRVGAFEFTKTGVSRYDFRDPYHLAVTLTWPRFFLALFAADLIINTIFALLYLIEPGSVANTRPGSFTDMFFFSMETLATVGYGVAAPVTLYAHIVASAEILCGLTFTALVTGVIFVRFSKPKGKILFADKAVVTVYNGRPTLMVRVCNGRLTLLGNASAHITAVLREESPEGHSFRRVHELKLERNRLTVFPLTWTLIHEIDEHSPLFGITSSFLAENNLWLVAFIEAHDHALGVVVNNMQDYGNDAILFGTRYQDVVTVDAEGRTNLDLTRLSAVEPDERPSDFGEARLYAADPSETPY
jgi:inward rectifier potassium channel